MRIHQPFTALCGALVVSLLVPAALAQAAPLTVNVRIEGATETLFEGPVAVEPHGVKASSDTAGKLRSCDGINSLDPSNAVPEPTPTSAAADAMGLIGETFDGRWYPGFNDYFITRFGPDREVAGKSWGILVNDTFSNVGGCQYGLDEGDEVLWIYNAFSSRPDLSLLPARLRLRGATADGHRDLEPALRSRSARLRGQLRRQPACPSGTRRIDAVQRRHGRAGDDELEGLREGRHGRPGHQDHRDRRQGADHLHHPGLASDQGDRARERTEEAAIRSNRIDVCVPAGGRTGCGALPAEDRVRMPPPTVGETEAPGESSGGTVSGGGSGTSPASGGGSGNGSALPAGGRRRIPGRCACRCRSSTARS